MGYAVEAVLIKRSANFLLLASKSSKAPSVEPHDGPAGDLGACSMWLSASNAQVRGSTLEQPLDPSAAMG